MVILVAPKGQEVALDHHQHAGCSPQPGMDTDVRQA